MNEQQDEQAKKPRLNLTMTQVAASALAACCASIVASYLGVAGTVIGAAVGSVVATTGAAIWGHLFRTGGDKIKQTLLVNGEEVEVEVDRDQAADEAGVPAGRFYGARASGGTRTVDLWHPKTPTGETRVITADSDGPPDAEAGETSASPTSPIGARIVRIKKYRKPMGIAAAIIAVFCVSIVVGVFAGAPVRSAGSDSSPATVTTTTTVTDTEHTRSRSSDGSSASSSSSASSGSGSTSSSSASPSSSATSSSGTGSTASPSASSSSAPTATSSGQALSGATSTGSPTS